MMKAIVCMERLAAVVFLGACLSGAFLPFCMH